MYLERRRRRWYALHDIPSDAQEALGRKRFVASLETEDRHAAARRATVLEARWRADIEKARSQSVDHIERDALFWRKALQNAPEAERDIIRDLIADEAREKVDRAAVKAGIVDHRDPRYDELPEHAEAERFAGIAMGQLVRLDEHLEEYLATLKNEAKTVDMRRSSIKKVAAEFPFIADVQRKGVQQWINKQVKDGKGVATVQRYISEMRGFWGYLISIEAVPEDVLPLEKLTYPKNGKKKGKADEREPFEPADVVKLHRAALEKEDQNLADLIELGMWTGARIEELCALKVEKVGPDAFKVDDAKTAAGWREVPIHTKLCPTIARLKKASADGYLLSGLTANKYGDRANAIGKRFGQLKTRLGFQKDKHVFHSIRKTVATLLENAGVAEGVAADILGHDKPTITFGLYSGGATLATKRTALEKIRYPKRA
jgi:integrase